MKFSRTGGDAVVVTDDELRTANDLARSATGIDVGHTGSAGLAGLLEDGSRRRRLADAARARAGTFRPERQAEEMLRIYEGARTESRSEAPL